MDEDVRDNIRDILGPLIGKLVVDITQHDPGEPSFVQLHFDDGTYLKFPIGDDGFHHNIDDPDEPDAA